MALLNAVANRRLFASNGGDTMLGTALNDTMFGGTGHDILLGGAGNDLLWGGFGHDRLDGGIGNDILNGEAGNDTLLGGAGIDRMFAGVGNDSLDGGDGADFMDAGAGNDTMLGGAGDDVMITGAGDDSALGGDGNDTQSGGDGNDTMRSGNGNDRLLGDAGNDQLCGAAGNDYIFAETGQDIVWGGDGNDTVKGGYDNDLVIGGNGADFMMGCEGNDFLLSRSDAGRPTGTVAETGYMRGTMGVASTGGNDFLGGGEGADLFRFELLVNAPRAVLERHANAQGVIDWNGVTTENAARGNHWVEGIGIDFIEGFGGARSGDKIQIFGHDIRTQISYRDWDSDGDLESFIDIFAKNSNVANAGEWLGAIAVNGARVTASMVEVHDDVVMGAFDTLSQGPNVIDRFGIFPHGWTGLQDLGEWM